MSIISTISSAAPQAAKAKTQGLFAFIMSALHASRRRQANLVLHQYEHLFTYELKQDPGERNGRCEQGGSSKIDRPVGRAE
ncbi:hypothetical protein [Bradyrhizobium sp. 1]|uniref:hypothetical protein n=1 Tax=Bradyrhizobium sp. 1 TaxID=241591 RepID=UPI001FF848CD|nr:hypothetical protein [Bradyrhizobium sp. 1]MCK1389491.1 hypothetical protein [Bradyrhizobium sp. 1]